MNKYTLDDFNRDFPNEDACLEYLKNLRWPDGISCEKCQRVTKHHRVKKRLAYACDFCGTHVYPQAGTILQDTRTPLRYWFHAIFLMGSTRCGISAEQLKRELNVSRKTAWRIFRMIRTMMDDGVMELLGEVEADESFFGGSDQNRHLSKRRGYKGKYSGKTTVFGMVERHGKVIATVVPTPPSSADLLPHIKAKVMPKSVIFTDEARFYEPLSLMGYTHKRVHHSARVYVHGDASTNTVESFWSLVKRGIDGVHHNVSAKYLQDYLNSYAFRWNHRDDDASMFHLILGRLPASRPTPTVAEPIALPPQNPF